MKIRLPGLIHLPDASIPMDTARLFIRLIRALRIDVVCDIGSLNGSDALAFRAALPRAVVYAFEANPGNVSRMQSSALLRSKRINIVPDAICDRDGEALFHVVTGESPTPFWLGMSSLYERPERADLESRSSVVKTMRLDTFLGDRLEPANRLALWIDVEGKTFEVIRGASECMRQVFIIHAEVESSACIAPEQRLYSEVRDLLESLGFTLLAASASLSQAQFNVVFARRDLSRAEQRLVRRCLALAVVRRTFRSYVRRLTPHWLLQRRATRAAARTFSIS